MWQQKSEHAGRVAVVTGGNSGIGRAIALRLQREGASVNVLDVQTGAGGTLADGPPGLQPISYYRCDVSKEAEVEAVFAEIMRAEAVLDYLLCCAAVFPYQPFLELSETEWQQTLDTNLTGAFLCCRAAVRYMRPRRFGGIILFSSNLARTGGVNSGHYAASKGGLLGLARSLALEVASEGIRVNIISPGVTDTPQPRGHRTEAELQAMAALIPLKRIGHVDDMVEASLFLLSGEASYITGQDLRVNGGAGLF